MKNLLGTQGPFTSHTEWYAHHGDLYMQGWDRLLNWDKLARRPYRYRAKDRGHFWLAEERGGAARKELWSQWHEVVARTCDQASWWTRVRWRERQRVLHARVWLQDQWRQMVARCQVADRGGVKEGAVLMTIDWHMHHCGNDDPGLLIATREHVQQQQPPALTGAVCASRRRGRGRYIQ